MTKLTYKNESGNIIFTNVTSKYLPNVSSFLSFWENHITIINDLDFTEETDDEYEVDELMTLYKNSDKKKYQISDTDMIKIICHYFAPQVEVIDNKYITNIKCNLWSKSDDINEFFESYKLQKVLEDEQDKVVDIISFDDLYESYKTYFTAKKILCMKSNGEQKINPIISKQFFEKYITTQLTKYVKFDKFVSSEWLTK